MSVKKLKSESVDSDWSQDDDLSQPATPVDGKRVVAKQDNFGSVGSVGSVGSQQTPGKAELGSTSPERKWQTSAHHADFTKRVMSSTEVKSEPGIKRMMPEVKLESGIGIPGSEEKKKSQGSNSASKDVDHRKQVKKESVSSGYE